MSGYVGDPKLVSRVRLYLHTHKSKHLVSIPGMAQDLQAQYSEYARKKKNFFCKSVERAYRLVCAESAAGEGPDKLSAMEAEHLKKRQKEKKDKTGGVSADSDSDGKSFSDDNPEYVAYADTNSMNNLMANLYRKSPKPKSQIQSGSRPCSEPASGASSPRRWFADEETSTPADSPKAKLFAVDRTGDRKHLKAEGHDASGNSKEIKEGRRSTPPPPGNQSTSGKSQSFNPADNEIEIIELDQEEPAPKTPQITKSEDVPEAATPGTKRSKKKQDNKSSRDVKKARGAEVTQSTVKFADIGGSEKVLKEVCKLLVHLKHPEVYQQLGVTPPRGFLLHGPPGCGKTLLAHAIAGELELPFIKMAATEVVSGVSGESEEKIRDVFDKAVASAPCVMFLDEIDAITPKRETASKDMERRIVSQLLTCMDDLSTKASAHVLVIGATNRPDSLDPALRRAGRFDREISLGIPDESARMRILQVLCRDLRLVPDFDFLHLARSSPGYVGADLVALAREAAMTAVNRIFQEVQAKKTSSSMEVEMSVPAPCIDDRMTKHCDSLSEQSPADKMNLNSCTSDDIELQSVLSWLKEQPPLTEEQLSSLWITLEDFQMALKVVQPSAKREGFATIPDVTWDDIGALHNVRQELQMAILAPVRHPDQFRALGLTSPPGILLAGPPGCGKTLLAKAVANESGINFISVKGPELLNMYVGESERAVRQVFQRARNSAPCVIFFDELDALCPRRSDGGEGGASVRVVNQLLTEMDGLEERKQVFIMGATNRPDIIDPAVLRPGRLDKMLYVGLPMATDRLDILRTVTKNGTKPRLHGDVDLEQVANNTNCEGFTGADLAALVREAAVTSLREFMSCPDNMTADRVTVTTQHFDEAFQKVRPSVSQKDQAVYDRIKQRAGVS